MAKGEGESVGKGVGHVIDLADHPLLFAFSITLMVIPMMALMTVLFAYLGMPGPQALTQHP